MKAAKRWLAALSLASVLMVALALPATADYPPESRHGFNDEYIYATTKAVHDMDTNPALKLTLYPVTIVLDTALLPFAVIAGFVT